MVCIINDTDMHLLNITNLTKDSLIVRTNARNEKIYFGLNVNEKSRENMYFNVPMLSNILTESCPKYYTNVCPDTRFIDELNTSLLTQLDGVVDFNFDDKSGFLLWFNINGRLKYCFQPESKKLSDDVRND